MFYSLFVVASLVQMIEDINCYRCLWLHESIVALIKYGLSTSDIAFWGDCELLSPESVSLTVRELENIRCASHAVEGVPSIVFNWFVFCHCSIDLI